MTNERLMALLGFEGSLESVEILKEEKVVGGAIFIVAKLRFHAGEAAEDEMTVPFVYYPGNEWIFTPCDWQAGDLPMDADGIDSIGWRVNDTDEEGFNVNGVPALMGYQPEPMEPARVVVGRMVREAREKAGLTTRELAEKAGLNYAHISRIESGRYNITIDTLEKIGRVLGLEVRLMDHGHSDSGD